MTIHRCPDCRCSDPVPPPAGRGSSDDKRRATLEITAAAVREAKEKGGRR